MERLRGDKFAETLDKESKRDKKTTKDSRATKEGEDVGMQISGGVFAAVANRLTSAAPVDGGKGDSLEENEGRIAEEWVKCHDGLHVFSVFFQHSEGWTMRNEELMKAELRRVANTKSLWITAVTPI